MESCALLALEFNWFAMNAAIVLRELFKECEISQIKQKTLYKIYFKSA